MPITHQQISNQYLVPHQSTTTQHSTQWSCPSIKHNTTHDPLQSPPFMNTTIYPSIIQPACQVNKPCIHAPQPTINNQDLPKHHKHQPSITSDHQHIPYSLANTNHSWCSIHVHSNNLSLPLGPCNSIHHNPHLKFIHQLPSHYPPPTSQCTTLGNPMPMPKHCPQSPLETFQVFGPKVHQETSVQLQPELALIWQC